MLNCLKYVNIIVQLADKRVLLYQGAFGSGRESDYRTSLSITTEREIKSTESALEVANEVLKNTFSINTHSYSDSFAEMKQLLPIRTQPDKLIIPFLIKLKSGIAFQIKPTDYFTAIKWSNILKDVMRSSVYQKVGNHPKHTPVAIEIARELTSRGVFVE